MPPLNRRHSRRHSRRGAGQGPSQRTTEAEALLQRLGIVEIAGGGVVVLVVLLLGALVVGAARAPVPAGAWAAALGLALVVATGLLYAFRLSASGRR
jgi:membrane protein implicated in regulation of membrane protease activity